jgi:hypothetical protein
MRQGLDLRGMARARLNDNRIGREAYGMVEREELTCISAGLQIRRISIHDADGTELDVEEALDLTLRKH